MSFETKTTWTPLRWKALKKNWNKYNKYKDGYLTLDQIYFYQKNQWDMLKTVSQNFVPIGFALIWCLQWKETQGSCVKHIERIWILKKPPSTCVGYLDWDQIQGSPPKCNSNELYLWQSGGKCKLWSLRPRVMFVTLYPYKLCLMTGPRKSTLLHIGNFWVSDFGSSFLRRSVYADLTRIDW